ncbi:MAG: hypothetical protein RL154_732 [Pseudomonadota bacterium]|jgi:hypothetical protein
MPTQNINMIATFLQNCGKYQSALLVEDDIVANRIAISFLEKFYTNISAAFNGEEVFGFICLKILSKIV